MKVREFTLNCLLLFSLCVMLLMGCRHSDTGDSMTASSTVVVVAPLGSSYVVADGADFLAQGHQLKWADRRSGIQKR